MIDDEDEASEQERAEAEALARALDGEALESNAPDDAVATAAFLRAVAVKDGLAPERARAVFDGLDKAVEHYVHPRHSNVIPLVWLGAGLAAAAAVALMVTRPDESSPAAHRETVADTGGVPAPPAALLAAQAALGSEQATDAERATFEREMSAYRASVLRALKSAYPIAVGMNDRARGR